MEWLNGCQGSRYIQEVHPLIKLALALAILIYSLVAPGLWPLLAYLLLLTGVLAALGLWKALWRALLLGLGLAAPVFVISVLLRSGYAAAAVSVLRITFMFVSVLVFCGTTSPARLSRSLKQWRLPPEIGIGLLITLRFIPVLWDEMGQVYQSYSLRLDNRSRNLAVIYRGLVIPFVFRMFTLADRLPLALQMKAFASRPRPTVYRQVTVRRSDWLFLLVNLFLMVAVRWAL